MIRKLTRRLGQRGQIILMVGLATIVMFGIVGLAVDVGRLYVTRVELGRSLDSAALSGILELNGQPQGLLNAEDKATDYFKDNEGVSTCDNSQGVWCEADANPDANELTMDATKTIKMFFLSVLGIRTATVSAHAKAGFGTQYLDAVMVLDATPSMAGNPITQAKAAAITFKDILLGTSPQGNVVVGSTAFRGCYKPSPTPHNDCVDKDDWATELTSSHSALETVINNIQGGGPLVGTNVCTGLANGWNIISDPSTNHDDDVQYPGNRQYLILLSDGDNYYPGNNTYLPDQDDPAASPMGTVISGSDYPCQPIDSCSSPWTGLPCQNGEFDDIVPFSEDDMDASGWGGGSGWGGDWTPSGDASKTTSGGPQGTRHIYFGNDGSITRTFSTTGVTEIDVEFAVKRDSSFSGDDRLRVRLSTNGTSWTTVANLDSGDIGTSYSLETVAVDETAFADQPTVYLRIEAVMDSDDDIYIDSLSIAVGTSEGFLDGNDGSSPTTCVSQTPTPRERQLDVRTLELARAIKEQEVEIFVVAFSGGVPGCNLDNTTPYNDGNPADCNTVIDPVAGPIGDTTDEGTANHRLLKCIASSSIGTNDHYYYASSEDELTGIFTAIANQIAHRLLE